ncbi:MAG: ATP-binding protein [Rhodocyclaceae bacterium]|nr:ATP-binding protein [Rhodocyclaceae bacterium]
MQPAARGSGGVRPHRFWPGGELAPRPRRRGRRPRRHLNPLRVSAAAEPAALDTLQAALGEFWAERGLPADARYAFELALEEFLMNVVMHGQTVAAAKTIWLELDTPPGAIQMVFEDDCAPFDPTGRDAPDTSLGVDERGIGGLGIHLVRQMMDRVDYAHASGRNRLTLTKHLAPASPDRASPDRD